MNEDFLKNNLRELRKRGGWSQAEVGQRAGFAHNTVSLYESGKLPLTVAIAEKFAKALEVGADDIEIVTDEMREDAPPNRVGTISLDILSDEILAAIEKDLAPRIVGCSGFERRKILAALEEIGHVKEARAAGESGSPPHLVMHERRKPGANSERVARLAASSKAALVKIGVLPADAAGGKGSHSPPSEVDAPSDQTHPRPPASSGESKAPPHGHGGKGQR